MHKWFTAVLTALWLGSSLQASAIEYTLPDIDGRMQSLDQYLGKWLVVNYWATWCGTCREELPDLIAMHERHKDGDIAVVGINFEDSGNDRLASFVDAQGITYPVLRSEPVPVTAIGKVPALPTTYIIDPQGRVVAGEIGLVAREDLEDYIAAQKSGNGVAPRGN